MLQVFFEDEDAFKCFAYLKKFICFDYVSVQLIAVQTLTKIFNKSWLLQHRDEMVSSDTQTFHLKLLEGLELDRLVYNTDDDIDRKACNFATRLQLYCSIFGTCYPLRKQIWFRIVEFCCHELQLKADKVERVIQRLCNDILHANPSDMLEYLTSGLIEFWIEHNYHLSELPWYLTKCQSSAEYIANNIQHITWNMLQYQPQNLNKLVDMVYADSIKDILQPTILVKGLAFATAINVTSTPELKSIKNRATAVVLAVRTHVPEFQGLFQTHPLEIIEELLHTTWDPVKFKELFDVDVEYEACGYVIDFGTLMTSVKSIQVCELKM